MSIDLKIICEDTKTKAATSNLIEIELIGVGVVEVKLLIKQLQKNISDCEILDHFDEEQLINYMQEEYGVTRMVK